MIDSTTVPAPIEARRADQLEQRLRDLEALAVSLTESLRLSTERATAAERLAEDMRLRCHELRMARDTAESAEHAARDRSRIALFGLSRKLIEIQRIVSKPWLHSDVTDAVMAVLTQTMQEGDVSQAELEILGACDRAEVNFPRNAEGGDMQSEPYLSTGSEREIASTILAYRKARGRPR